MSTLKITTKGVNDADVFIDNKKIERVGEITLHMIPGEAVLAKITIHPNRLEFYSDTVTEDIAAPKVVRLHPEPITTAEIE